MTRNQKRLLAATLLELTVRTTAKVRIPGTSRGNQKITPEMYAEANLNIKNEMSVRGMLNV